MSAWVEVDVYGEQPSLFLQQSVEIYHSFMHPAPTHCGHTLYVVFGTCVGESLFSVVQYISHPTNARSRVWRGLTILLTNLLGWAPAGHRHWEGMLDYYPKHTYLSGDSIQFTLFFGHTHSERRRVPLWSQDGECSFFLKWTNLHFPFRKWLQMQIKYPNRPTLFQHHF